MSESKQEFVVKKLDIKDAILLPTAAQPIVEKKPDVTKIPMVNMKKSVSLEKPSKIFVAKKPAPAAKKLTPPSTQPEIKPVITNATTLVSKDIALREAAVLPPPQFECKSFVELSREYRSARQQMLNETQRQQAQRSAPKRYDRAKEIDQPLQLIRNSATSRQERLQRFVYTVYSSQGEYFCQLFPID